MHEKNPRMRMIIGWSQREKEGEAWWFGPISVEQPMGNYWEVTGRRPALHPLNFKHKTWEKREENPREEKMMRGHHLPHPPHLLCSSWNNCKCFLFSGYTCLTFHLFSHIYFSSSSPHLLSSGEEKKIPGKSFSRLCIMCGPKTENLK